MVLQWFYDGFLALNPMNPRRQNYRAEEMQELPALPDLAHQFSPLSALGTYRYKQDPRFPNTNAQNQRKCYINFAVWRRCLEEKGGEDMDEDHPDAQICRRYHDLAFNTCYTGDYNFLKESVEKDAWMWAIGLNKPKKGSNPSVLVIEEDMIAGVINQNENDERKWKVGTSVNDYRTK